MTVAARPSVFARARLMHAADWLAIATAASLPWSTSATGILIVLWLLALAPTLEADDIRRAIALPAGGLPVLLFALGVAGMLWADVNWPARLDGLVPFFRLLVIPLLFVHFRRSERGLWVFAAYLAACLVLLLLSWLIYVWPDLWWTRDDYAVPVKNAAAQSGEFVICIAGLLYLAIDYFERRQWLCLSAALVVVLGMAANFAYVATGRTALVMLPVLVAILAAKKLNGKGMAVLFAGAAILVCAAWISSPYLRARTNQLWTDYQQYEKTDARNSSGERLEFWKKSVKFIREAPAIGHGTGSIHALYLRTIVGQTGAAASDSTNPHNQTFTIAVQLGLVGAAVLWAMWFAHLLLFRGAGLPQWIGLLIVVQNIIGSLFNSHLFDFTQGWVYVFGVGVAGGMVLKRRRATDLRARSS